MRFGIATVIALILGCGIAFWLFGLAFTRSIDAMYADVVLPLLVTAMVCTVLAGIFREQAFAAALGMTLPTAIWFTYTFSAVFREGRGPEWSHLLMPGLVGCAAVVGAVVGRRHTVPRRRKDPTRLDGAQ